MSEVRFAGLVEAEEAVDALGLQRTEGKVRTEATVGEQDVALLQVFPELAEQEAFMDMQVVFCKIQKCPAV